jgi:tetratricopeptide (TPR) repeat protein
LIGTSRVGWAIVGITIAVVFAQNITAHVVNIESISVPKLLADSGYTSDVASQCLRDALTRFAKETGSSMQGPNLALPYELPKITVPKVEISLDTATALVRNLLRVGNTRNISGEFVLQGEILWLRLRIDGQEIFTGKTTGFDPTNLDELLNTAAPNIIQEIRPYLIASATYKDDPGRALEIAEGIIARLPASDVNVQWSYVLKGKYYLDRHQPDLAESYLRKAIDLNSENTFAHYSLGVALENEGKLSHAIAEYRRATEIQESFALAHNNLGALLEKQQNIDTALVEYRLAIAWDPRYAAAYSNLGTALKKQGHMPEAIAEYRRAIEINPTFNTAHYNLGVTFRDQGENEEAITEFQRALENKSDYLPAHIGLANTLLDLKRTDEALKEYQLIIAIDPNNEIARRNIEYLSTHAIDANSK